jgi:hypothetical protein
MGASQFCSPRENPEMPWNTAGLKQSGSFEIWSWAKVKVRGAPAGKRQKRAWHLSNEA